MNILIIGRPDSGKSALAEGLAVDLAGDGPKKYIATMIPFGEEGKKRIEKHRRMREGKGFDTIECPVGIDRLPEVCTGDRNVTGSSGGEGKFHGEGENCLSESTCLLECMSNLVGNEMHSAKNRHLDKVELKNLICGEVDILSRKVKNLIIVSNEFEPCSDTMDEDTEKYIELVHQVNISLRPLADRAYTCMDGGWKLEENI